MSEIQLGPNIQDMNSTSYSIKQCKSNRHYVYIYIYMYVCMFSIAYTVNMGNTVTVLYRPLLVERRAASCEDVHDSSHSTLIHMSSLLIAGYRKQ